MPPNRDVVKSKLVPPQIEHGLVESQDLFFRDKGRRRHELAQPVVDEDSLLVIDARQEMPQREGIAFASLAQDDNYIMRTLLRRGVLKIEPRQSRAELCGGILEVWRSGTDLRPGCTSSARRDKGFVAIQLESDPSQRCAHHGCARIVDLQSVSTTKIDRYGRRRVDYELTGRRPDVGMNRSAIQSNPLQS